MTNLDEQTLYQSLKELAVIDPKQLTQVYETSQTQKLPFDKLLLEKDLISDENLGKAVADILKIPFIRLSTVAIPEEILKIIPELVAKKQNIIAFKKDAHGLHIATDDPSNLEIVEFVKKKAGLPVALYYATKQDINNSLLIYEKDVKEAFTEIIDQNIKQVKGIKGQTVEPPIIKIVDTILSYAYKNKASDIHIEPQKDNSIVRFRIDGVLHDVVTIPEEIHLQVSTRIKVLSKLRTDEHQAPQDGKISYTIEDEGLDIRVSIVPITFGEQIVMRLLSSHARQFSLTNLGFSEKDFKEVNKAYQKPYGMILSTGPTGSGKTTTIYAILKLLNERNVNIMTIEDPVEYEIAGVNQIQVNPKTSLNFASGLKSILRQDPNIILVGEIRDNETADIAVNAAMTGHLVLSTLHTNDAATTIPRLLDMGIDPYLVASTVNVIIGQRLVRKIHEPCRVSQNITHTEICKYFSKEEVEKIFHGEKDIRTYTGKGCKLDHNTGYEDRVGIFEVLVVDDDIRDAIINRQDASSIRKIAIKNGMVPIIEDGLEKLKQGITTIEEIIRVTKE